MLYNDIKIIHIISASFFMMSLFLSAYFFFKTQADSDYLQKQTILSIIPLAILQLVSGFTMLTLQSISFTQTWVIGSLIGFIILIIAWMGFIFFSKAQRKIAMGFVMVCLMTLLSMVFLMSSKI